MYVVLFRNNKKEPIISVAINTTAKNYSVRVDYLFYISTGYIGCLRIFSECFL